MGMNKALLAIDATETLIGRVVNNLRPLSDDLIVVSNTPEAYANLGVRQASDRYANSGPLAGLQSGLLAAAHEWAFVVACDMPLVNHRLVRYMIVLSPGYDAVVPRLGEDPEPLHALYSRACLPAIEAQLSAQQRRVIAFYPAIRMRYVEAREIAVFDPAGRSFFNANTPEDWQRLQHLLRESSPAA